MPFFLSFSQALAAATLLLRLCSAQRCYYPDGTPSTDVPCSDDADASCCGSSAFCMDSGLCFQSGIVSRGSCTDRTWGSEACAGYCKNELPGGSVSITPCSTTGASSTFVCGLNSTACEDDSQTFEIGGGAIVLRTMQVQALVGRAVNSEAAQTTSTTTATACAVGSTDVSGLYSAGQMAGLGCALGIPLLIAICAVFFLFQKERSRRPPKLMYPLPDNAKDDFGFRSPSPIDMRHPALRTPLSRDGSVSIRSMQSMRSDGRETPAHMQNFYQSMNSPGTPRVQMHRAIELEGSPMRLTVERHELGERMSSYPPKSP